MLHSICTTSCQNKKEKTADEVNFDAAFYFPMKLYNQEMRMYRYAYAYSVPVTVYLTVN